MDNRTPGPPVYYLRSPIVSGLVRLDHLVEVDEAGPVGTADGEFHSYGFALHLSGLEEPLVAAGFSRIEDAEEERAFLLEAKASPDPDLPYNVFEDVEELPRYAPLVTQALAEARADDRTRYVIAEPDGGYRISVVAATEMERWYLVAAPDGEVRLEQKLDAERMRPIIDQAVADGSLVPVDPKAPHRRRVVD